MYKRQGLKTACEDGKLVIVQEGAKKKFVNQVEHITFSGKYAVQVKQPVLYITERAVFEPVSYTHLDVYKRQETSCVEEIIHQAARRGMRTAMNAAPANEKLVGLPLEALSWLLVNEVEGAFLAGTEAPEAILDTLAARYPETTVVLTLGEQGAAAARGGWRAWGPARKTAVVDTTAAGDTFTGYFLSLIHISCGSRLRPWTR